MTQDEIIEMYLQVSKELCNDTEWCWAGVGEPLQMFAKLVAAKAIAELESQEPFGYFRYDIRLDAWVQNRDSNRGAALYTHPPQRTEQERDEILQAITDQENQPSQFGTVTLDFHFEKIKKWEDLFERMSDKVLAQRTWVELTDEEATEVYAETEKKVNEHWESGGTTMMFPPTLYKAIEAKLKEKNT